MKYLLLLTMLTLAINANASIDASTSAVGRTYPLSSSIDLNSGYNIVVWKKDEIKFGYIRPNISFLNAGSYNEGTAELSFFPISFFNISAGARRIINNSKYDQFDCQANNCTGKFKSKYISVKQLLGYKNTFGFISYGLDKRRQETNNKPFILPGAVLKASKESETVRTLKMLGGYKITKQYAISIMYKKAEAIHSSSSVKRLTINGQYKGDKWSTFVAIGKVLPTIKRDNYTALAGVTWTLIKGIGLN